MQDALYANGTVANPEQDDVLADGCEPCVRRNLSSETINSGLFGNLFEFRPQQPKRAHGVSMAILCNEIADLFEVAWDERRKVNPHQRAFFAGAALGFF